MVLQFQEGDCGPFKQPITLGNFAITPGQVVLNPIYMVGSGRCTVNH